MRSHYDANSAMLLVMATKPSRQKALNPDRRRRALRDYMKSRNLNANAWAKAAGIAESTIRNFLNGDSDSLSDRTYQLLARADDTTVANLQGEQIDREPGEPEAPIRSFVGAGDEILIMADGADALEYVPTPPGLDDGEATLVRGASMKPLFHDGDVLFHRRVNIDPLRLRDEVVVLETKTRKRYVKLIQPGSKKGLFRLVSLNPLFPPLEDQAIAWVAPIAWVRKKPRM